MNNQEAKFILSAYRANGADAQDEVFAEALRHAQRDPLLGGWFARQQAHDAEVVRKLKEVAPPAELRDSILTGARMGKPRRAVWRPPIWIALGAAAALVLVVSSVFWRSQDLAQSDGLLEFALNDTERGHHGDGGEAVVMAQTLLSDPQKRLSAGLPPQLADLKKIGCRTLNLRGEDVFEICFNRNGKWFHLYAVRIAPQAAGRTTTDMVIKENNRMAGAMWTDPKYGYRYALVGDGGVEDLKSLL